MEAQQIIGVKKPGWERMFLFNFHLLDHLHRYNTTRPLDKGILALKLVEHDFDLILPLAICDQTPQAWLERGYVLEQTGRLH